MKRTPCALRTIQLALLAALGVTAGNLAFAQQSEEEVVVETTRPATVVGRSLTGTPVEVTTVTRKVRYADLDLTTHTGAKELAKRVNDTAKIVCRQLDKIYPATVAEGPACIRKASRDGMVQASAAIDSAVHAR